MAINVSIDCSNFKQIPGLPVYGSVVHPSLCFLPLKKLKAFIILYKQSIKLGLESLGFLIHAYFGRPAMNLFFNPSALRIFRNRKKNQHLSLTNLGRKKHVTCLSLYFNVF